VMMDEARQMKVIAFTGLPWAGKSEAVSVAKNMGIPVVRMGDMVWDETRKQGLEITNGNVGIIANKLRQEQGMDIWARRTIEKLKEIDHEHILVIDGVRNFEEIETFKRVLGDDFLLVAIHVPDEIRYKRAMDRNRTDDSKDLSDIKARDHRERSWGLDKVISSADILIENDGSLEELQSKVQRYFLWLNDRLM